MPEIFLIWQDNVHTCDENIKVSPNIIKSPEIRILYRSKSFPKKSLRSKFHRCSNQNEGQDIKSYKYRTYIYMTLSVSLLLSLSLLYAYVYINMCKFVYMCRLYV